jgi:hypothetical protein
LIGALIQVGLTGSLAVLMGGATGTDPVARLWSGLSGADFGGAGGAAAATLAAAAASASSSSPLALAAATAAPYFIPLLVIDALLFAVPWSMPKELLTTSHAGRRCVDARAIGGGESGGGGGGEAATATPPLPLLLQAGLALHRNVALLPPRLATVAFADGPDSDDDEDDEEAQGGSGAPKPQTREERLAALGLRPPPRAAAAAAAAAAATPPSTNTNTPLDDAAALPLPYEAALIAARELSKELLQRGVLLVFCARWLSDRLGEAGVADENGGAVAAAAAAVSATALGASLAASLLTASIVPAAAGEAASVRAAAAAALVASSRDVVEAAERRQQEEGGGEAGEDDDDDDAASSSSSPVAESSAPPPPSGLLLDYRVLETTELALGSLPPAVSGGLALARVVYLAAAANACFVESGGNLAATWLGAVAVNEVFGLGYRGWAKGQAEAERARRSEERRRLRGGRRGD